MSDLIKKLWILDGDDRTLFDLDDQYIVPLYQRAYAWEEKEIVQLIHDIDDMEQKEDTKYYLGSLIVSRNGNEYEVIDGQQRLTTLFIILKILAEKGALIHNVSNTLCFSCRDKSNYTLKNLSNLIEDDRIEENIRAGRDIVLSELNNVDSVEHFVELLKKVVLYRIEVPQNTDLNRYFEIMNTRGEQLEQHDILKAKLMSFLTDSSEKAWFANIWDACSDMTGYVQMHFEVEVRETLFGGRWDSLPSFEDLGCLGAARKNDSSNNVTIHKIIRDDFKVEKFDGIDDNSDRIRFESIIEFPYFLLHVLRIFVETKNIVRRDGSVLIKELLDDKKLISVFDNVVSNGVIESYPISEQSEWFAREFIKCLLQCRYLFDKYILKREYVNEDSEGKWSIKELQVSGQKSKKKAYYRNSDFGCKGEHDKTRERRTRNNIMLQSCFRVSYTSPKNMHWITELLKWLKQDNCINLNQLTEYEAVSENIARRVVKKEFLDECKGDYNLGVNTPHIVFNYLDYLLWKETGDEFIFEFRNSVEHWYPQHPSEGTLWTRDEGLDNFGNLCIIQRSVNSKFSNMPPEAKKSTFEVMIRKGSLKLRRMAALTTGQDGKSASVLWREGLYLQHEQEMINRLIAACEA